MSWTGVDPWHCHACGADGLGGRGAYEQHVTDVHAPKPSPARSVGSVVPPGVDSRHVRGWGRAHGWQLGSRGRLPQDLIDAYLQEHPCTPT